MTIPKIHNHSITLQVEKERIKNKPQLPNFNKTPANKIEPKVEAST